MSEKHKLYASLLALGACVLLYRTMAMMLGGALSVLQPWVALLLVLEFIVDVAVLVASLRWWMQTAPGVPSLPLRLGATAALLHAFRVLIFVLGRTGPWVDFDVRPEQRVFHAERWTWGEVYVAAVLSVLGVVGVVVLWQWWRRHRP